MSLVCRDFEPLSVSDRAHVLAVHAGMSVLTVLQKSLLCS